MPTVPPAPGSFNGYDENYRGFSPSRAAGLPDELSATGSRIGPTPASGEPQLDPETLSVAGLGSEGRRRYR